MIKSYDMILTALNQLVKNGVQEQELIKITVYNNANSVKTYLNIVKEDHNKIINTMLSGEKSSLVIGTNTSKTFSKY